MFLQGPHGPFFHQLGKMLGHTGADVWRVGFNAGDKAFWFDRSRYIPYLGVQSEWPDHFEALIDEKAITDLVLYGDTRAIHAKAIERAKARGLRVHVFEEGYIRPYWVTYERGGSNGHSRLMDMRIDAMQQALAHSDMDAPLPPARWGDMREHVFYGALYHFFVMFRNRAYRNFEPHRALPVAREFRLHLKKLLLMPALALERFAATARIRWGGFPYHLALLQLEHDSSFQMHSPFASMTEFLEVVMRGFAEGAPKHHHLVFKAHPLEDGRVPLPKQIRRLARDYGVESRVHFVRGGKLARLLDEAKSAVTVNSTAAQQVLWRGIPLKSFGDAVFNKPELISNQPLPDFFANPTPPDSKAYRCYRRYLLETSQIAGGFYSARGRKQALRSVVDMMLAPHDSYEALSKGTAAPRQQLHLVN